MCKRKSCLCTVQPLYDFKWGLKTSRDVKVIITQMGCKAFNLETCKQGKVATMCLVRILRHALKNYLQLCLVVLCANYPFLENTVVLCSNGHFLKPTQFLYCTIKDSPNLHSPPQVATKLNTKPNPSKKNSPNLFFLKLYRDTNVCFSSYFYFFSWNITSTSSQTV